MRARCLADHAVIRIGDHVGFEQCVRRRGHWLWHRDYLGFRWISGKQARLSASSTKEEK